MMANWQCPECMGIFDAHESHVCGKAKAQLDALFGAAAKSPEAEKDKRIADQDQLLNAIRNLVPRSAASTPLHEAVAKRVAELEAEVKKRIGQRDRALTRVKEANQGWSRETSRRQKAEAQRDRLLKGIADIINDYKIPSAMNANAGPIADSLEALAEIEKDGER